MSEGDVSLIRDEDVLRRMWQQTEDFARKKEIRAHMYRLREERLRTLYSPEPALLGKGCEFTPAEDHVKSFANQTFQSMKSKEVRDAGSPPKDFTYRGQDLKELSNAGWNVESEDKTTNDGHTHVKTVQANIEGRYDVEGGKGHFAAIDQQKQAVTEYQDDNSSLKRNETSSKTGAHEQVVRKTDDGSHFSSTTSSSTSTSKFQEVSSTKHEKVPFVTNDVYDLSRQDTNRNVDETSKRQVTKTNDYDQNLRRSDFEHGDLVSRKIEYPDDNTKIIVETRCLPDGTRVTSTRREFRAPVVQTSHSEHHSQKSKTENKSYTTSQQRSDIRESSSKTIHETVDNDDFVNNRISNIVDSQRNIDVIDFKRNRQIDDSTIQKDDYSHNYNVTKKEDYSHTTQKRTNQRYETDINEVNKRQIISSLDNKNTRDITESQSIKDDIDAQSIRSDTRYVKDNAQYIKDDVDTQSIRSETRYIKDNAYYVKDNTETQSKVNETRFVSDDNRCTKNTTRVIRDDTRYARDDTKFVTDDIQSIKNEVRYIRNDLQSVQDDTQSITNEVRRTRDDTHSVKNDTIRNETRYIKDDTPHYDRDKIPDTQNVNDNVERIINVTKDKKVEDVIIKKTNTDQHHTTKQNDYTQKKISMDWSPTHQAWASTLRSDTPSTTRPSTRASSPGSKTFKSSNSSLRSSVSPDKTCRKPSSRGGSPSKVDRYSPSRTQTTHLVTDTKINKSTSPERRQPHAVSPPRPGYSPDRKPQDAYRPRTNASPEKQPHGFSSRPSTSPERKPEYKPSPIKEYSRTQCPTKPVDNHQHPTPSRPVLDKKPNYQSSDKISSSYSSYPLIDSPARSRASPEKIVPDGNEDTLPTKPNQCERKPSHEPCDTPSLQSNYPHTDSPQRSIVSPDKVLKDTSPTKPIQTTDKRPETNSTDFCHNPEQQPSPVDDTLTPDKMLNNKYPKESPPTRPSTSPDRKPEYGQPSPVDQKSISDKKPIDKYPDQSSPSRSSISPDRKSEYQQPSSVNYTSTSGNKRTNKYPKESSPMRPSASPDRKAGYRHPSPNDHKSDKKPSDKYPKESSPTRPRVSPDRKAGYQQQSPDDHESDKKPSDKYPKESSPTRPSVSPGRKAEYRQPSPDDHKSDKKPSNKYPKESSPTRPGVSPDRKAGYRQPSPDDHKSDKKPSDKYPKESSPTRSRVSSDRKTGYRQPSPDEHKSDKSPSNKYPKESSPTRPRISPDRKAGYRQPSPDDHKSTLTRKPSDKYLKESCPTRPSVSPDRKLEYQQLSPVDQRLSPAKNLTEKCPKQSSPSRSTISPDRKPGYRQSSPIHYTSSLDNKYPKESSPTRPSVSPDKKANRIDRQSSPIDHRSTPHNKSTIKYPKESSPTRSSISPDRKLGYRQPSPINHRSMPDKKSTDKYPKESFSTKSNVSPDRKLGYRQPSPIDNSSNSDTKPIYKYPKESSPTRPTISPDRKPGYMKPTAASKQSSPPDNSRTNTTRPYVSPERKSLTKQALALSPERKTYDRTTTTNQIKEDHYKFVDEETKTYNRIDDKPDIVSDFGKRTPKDNSTILSRRSPAKDVIDFSRPDSPSISTSPTLRNNSRSPSPSKGPVCFIKNNSVDKTEYMITNVVTTDVEETTKENTINDKCFPQSPKENTSRETSPINYGTYDKKQRRSEDVKEISTVNTTKIEDVKNDTLTYRPKSDSPKKPKSEQLASSSKSPLKDNVSPLRSPTKDRYKHTTDFISMERTTEETNKKTTTKDRPRQLVTPSTSPSRKPKPIEKAPSTGQSSPTTSVSGFVYFSSPRNDKKIITDSDEQQFCSDSDRTEDVVTTFKRPDSLDVKRSPSPSKIPCRTPSPEKRSPSKDTLPRKSSLKKPSVDFEKLSPTEKPPSSFRVSPTDEVTEFRDHGVVKKDHPDKLGMGSPMKPKPPLERRETYEERCRKILGMTEDDSTTTTVTKEIYKKEQEPSLNSPSVSPCGSPIPKEESSFRDYTNEEIINDKIDINEFLTHEQQDILKSTRHGRVPSTTRKTPVRDSSPTKLQDIISTKTVEIDTQTKSIRNDTTTNSEDIHEDTTFLSKTRVNKYPSSKPSSAPTRKAPEHPSVVPTKSGSPSKKSDEPRYRSSSPTKRNTETTENVEYVTSEKEQEILGKVQKSLRKLSPNRNEKSPNRERSPTTTTTTLQQVDVSSTNTTKNKQVTDEEIININETKIKSKDFLHPEQSKDNKPRNASPYKQPPSVNQKTTTITDKVTEFVTSEREQEILDRVQKSLRKLSPDRSDKSSREKSPVKSSSNLQDLNVISTETEQLNIDVNKNSPKLTKLKNDKPNEQKVSSKPPSRNTSPIKKSGSSIATKVEKTPESPTKPRSVSPRKPATPTERPQSPQAPKTSGTKPKESVSYHVTKKPTINTTSPTKTDKIMVLDGKNILGVTKVNNFPKTSPTKSTTKLTQSLTNKGTEHEPKRVPTLKNVTSSKKDTEVKVARTSSDISLKSKKISPQRVKSKPEIHVSDVSTTKTSKQNIPLTRTQKPIAKEPHKLTNKPKSATALNVSMDEDEVIIEVQQAKSSRENSPDRICPTPIDFLDDIGTPRLPDEVSEPDDDFRKRTHHIIHETETIVDDIVEISEDEELFVKRTDLNRVTESDECLLSVSDKVSKFSNKVDAVKKPKQSTEQFKDTERKEHSDFIQKDTKSDECLLSVSEKVTKFAKGPRDTKDKSPSRRIIDEYDTNTVYQDDYTKLSVTDKAHLFVETAESIKTPKTKPTQKVERPDLSKIDDSLKSDDCLLSVSDKVNKFVKTAEQFLCETHEVEEKEKRIKEKHEKIMRELVENIDDENDDTFNKVTTQEPDRQGATTPNYKDRLRSFAKETESSHSKHKHHTSHNLKPEKTSTTQDEINRRDVKTPDYHDRSQSFIRETESPHIKNRDQPTSNPKSNEDLDRKDNRTPDYRDRSDSFAKETESSHAKNKDYMSPNLKSDEKAPVVKITTLRSSEAVKKAKALFENIASTTQKTKNISHYTTKSTKLTDIGVTKKSPKTDSTIVLHPSVEDSSPNITDVDSEVDAPQIQHIKDRSTGTPNSLHHPTQRRSDKPRSSPGRLAPESHNISKSKSPVRQTFETRTTKTLATKTLRPEGLERAESPKHQQTESEKPQEKMPGYQRPTKTSQIREETKTVEETEISSRRGSGKFGVELRRTSIERSTVSSERRRSSVDHHQPCIEDIFDLDLLEQMLEKVVGYEQRRRIRAQIRVAKKKVEMEDVESSTVIRKSKQNFVQTSKSRSPERQTKVKSPDPQPKSTPQKSLSPERPTKSTPQKTISPDRIYSKEQTKPLLNGHVKEPIQSTRNPRTRSPEKTVPKSVPKTRSPTRQPSPDKKVRPLSPTKTNAPKPKTSRFSEYASAYMKKVGLNETDKLKHSDVKSKKAINVEIKQTENQETINNTTQHFEEHKTMERRVSSTSISKTIKESMSSKDTTEVTQTNGKRSSSPEKKHSPERKTQTPTERLYQRTPSPEFKRPKTDTGKKEMIIKTVYDIEKKIQPKQVQEEKPSWVTNRNLKKITSETRTFSNKKIENEKPKYRAPSPSKVITKPIDVITSSYGPGPLDADGKPLFGIKALRNGANYQVKGTVIRQEYHSRNGGEPEGTVSVTAYSTEPEELEKLLQIQGERPSRLHGLAAITTTKKFGGDSGTTMKEVHSKEERATLDQFTHSDRRVTESKQTTEETHSLDSRKQERVEETIEKIHSSKQKDRRGAREETRSVSSRRELKDKDRATTRPEDRKTVRQSSVKSLTEKYIKSTSDTSKTERSAYPKAGLILRTTTMKDSVSSDSSTHAGLARTDSEHSLASVDDNVITTTTVMEQDGERGHRTVTTTTRSHGHVARTQDKSFLDSSTKVTGVQDILSRMKNADIVIEEGDSNEDAEARALLNKFLGASVLMAGMQGYVTEKPSGKVVVKQETVRSSGGKVTSSNRTVQEIDLDQCWDERVLKKLLEECTDYEQRRRLRARLRTLMAEQEACASAVTDALAAAGESTEAENTDAREEEEVTTVTSSVRRNSSEKTVSSSTTTKTSRVIESMSRPAPKPVSPFAKFRQLEKQSSTSSPKM